MITVKYEITNQRITITEKPYLVDNSHNYLELRFQFLTEDWRNLNKYLILHKCGKHYLFELESDNDDCNYTFIVPGQYMVGDRLTFSLYGENVESEKRITVESKTLILRRSLYTTDISTPSGESATDLILILEDKVEHIEEEILEDVYTREETDTLLNGKSDTGHTHTVADITDFNSNVETEIKSAYRFLRNTIYNYGE